MEAGYDYLLLRSGPQQRLFRASGILLAITGAILLSAGIAYYAYAYKARSDLGQLNVSIAQTLPQQSGLGATTAITPSTALGAQAAVRPIAIASPGSQGIGAAPGELAQARFESPPPPNAAPPLPPSPSIADVSASQSPDPPLAEVTVPLQIYPSAVVAQQLYPGEAVKATYWGNPLEYEPTSLLESSLVRGFKSVDSSKMAAVGTLPAPTRVIIPSIGVDSEVAGLEIMDLGDSRAYETPKHVVGHIPEGSNPGEEGSAWLFGHLESPIAREGSVFYELPKIPGLLRQGQDVYVIVENGTQSFLYRITEALVVRQEDLKLDYAYLKELKPEYAQLEPGGANIHLVACVPKLVYDHRLVVSGELVGIRS